jgi:hypothetical protein
MGSAHPEQGTIIHSANHPIPAETSDSDPAETFTNPEKHLHINRYQNKTRAQPSK